jgi:hypothetical protein
MRQSVVIVVAQSTLEDVKGILYFVRLSGL